MAINSSTSLTTNALAMCQAAYNILLSQYGSDKTLVSPSSDYSLALLLLNWVLKYLQALSGGLLWKKDIGYVFLDQGHITYTLGSDATNSIQSSPATLSYNTTTMTAIAATGATSLTVASTSGMTTGDYIMIPLSTGLWQMSGSLPPTITVVNSTTLTLSTGLTDTSGLAIGVRLFTFTSFLDKPMRVYKMGLRQYQNSDTTNNFYDRELQDYYSFDDYQCWVTDKTSGGQPTGYAYIPERTVGSLYMRGVPSDNLTVGLIAYQGRVADLVNTTDEIDVPSEWFLPISYELAYRLSWTLEVDLTYIQALGQEADKLIKAVLHGDMEQAPMRIELDRR